MMKVVIASVLTVFLFSSCAQDVANRYYSQKRYPAKPQNEVLLLAKAPSRAYEVIADFQSRNEGPPAMQKKAAEIGADAVIVTTLGGLYQLSDEWASRDSQSKTYSRIIGTAIIYK